MRLARAVSLRRSYPSSTAVDTRPLTLDRAIPPSGPTVWLRLLGKRDRMPQHQLPGAAVATEDHCGRSGDVLRGAVHRVVLVDPTGQYPCFPPNALLRISKLRPGGAELDSFPTSGDAAFPSRPQVGSGRGWRKGAGGAGTRLAPTAPDHLCRGGTAGIRR